MVVVAGLKRQRRVSWARDDNLCKVRLFLSEDAPSQSGFGAQDHLQAKAAWLLHSTGMVDSDDSLPPGFEKLHKLQPKFDISQIPIIKWQRPPRLAVNPEWLVVAGEESQEVAKENQRLLGVLEAVYPRPSSIPPNPAVALEAQDATVNDSQTPLIPMIAIEEEDTTEETDAVSASNRAPLQSQSYPDDGSRQRIPPQDLRSSLRQPPSQPNEGSQNPNLRHVETPSMAAAMVMAVAGMAPGAEPDFVAAASAAFTAIMKSSEEGSLVDRDLLIEILSNPGMIERLASEYGGPKQIAQALATPPVAATSAGAPPHNASLPRTAQHVAGTSGGAPPKHASLPLASQYMAATSVAIPPPPPPPPGHAQISAISPLSAHSFQLPNMTTPSTLNAHRPPGQMPTMPPVNAPVVKDANYYKSLIQLHGGEKQEALALDQKPLQFKNAGHRFSSSGRLQHDYHHNNMIGWSNLVGAFGHGIQKQAEMKPPKVLKPCVYFNTPRGCRHGAGCLFQHDGYIHRAFEQQKGTSKRIKLDRGIGGGSS